MISVNLVFKKRYISTSSDLGMASLIAGADDDPVLELNSI